MRSGTIFCGLSYSKFLHAPDRLNANLLSAPKGRRFYLLPSPSQVFIDLATCIVWVCLNGSAKYCGDQMPSIPGIRLGIWYQMLSVASFLCTIQKLQRIIDCHMFCVSRLDTGQISLDAPASLEELFVIDWRLQISDIQIRYYKMYQTLIKCLRHLLNLSCSTSSSWFSDLLIKDE